MAHQRKEEGEKENALHLISREEREVREPRPREGMKKEKLPCPRQKENRRCRFSLCLLGGGQSSSSAASFRRELGKDSRIFWEFGFGAERRLHDRFGPGKEVRGLLLLLEVGGHQPLFAEIGPHGRPLSTVEVSEFLKTKECRQLSFL